MFDIRFLEIWCLTVSRYTYIKSVENVPYKYKIIKYLAFNLIL